MNSKDRNSLTTLLNQTKEVYQNVSRRIPWSPSDSENLDDILHLQIGVQNRIIVATASRKAAEITPLFLIYKAWERTKAVYSFTKELVDDLIKTDDTILYIYPLEHLPFNDLLLFFPEKTLPKIKNEETAGIYVHMERHQERLRFFFHYLDREYEPEPQIHPGIILSFPITDKIRVSQVFETFEFQKWGLSYKQTVSHDQRLNEQEVEMRLVAEVRIMNTAFNLLYYLSSKNADIKEAGHHTKPRKKVTGETDDNASEVLIHDVGETYTAEIIYRRHNADTAQKEDEENDYEDKGDTPAHTEKSGKTRRAHLRRAHFQHYWTGEGRRIPVVHWIPPLYVGKKQEDMPVVVYEQPIGSLKKKRNPNTSKKKRKKDHKKN